tara:strand:+ start:6400 stop:7341 length:942 start_codon:yes stop_codon:yes gene_type:complete
MLWKSYLLGIMSFTLGSALSPAWKAAGKIFKDRIDGNLPPVYELENIVPPESPCVLFFSGLNSLIPGEIYEEFLNNLATAGVSVYSAPPDLDESIDLLDDLADDYANVTVVGHSSGSINAIIAANSNRRVKNAVLMDPVNGGFFVDGFAEKDLTFKNVENLLYLNAAKSYEWGSLPNFKIPFIPAFKLTPDKIKLKKGQHQVIEASDFGHTDILDDVWSDAAHETMKSGTLDRNNKELVEYRFWLSSVIKSFITGEKLDEMTVTTKDRLGEAINEASELYADVSAKFSEGISNSLKSMNRHKLNHTSILYRKL